MHTPSWGGLGVAGLGYVNADLGCDMGTQCVDSGSPTLMWVYWMDVKGQKEAGCLLCTPVSADCRAALLQNQLIAG